MKKELMKFIIFTKKANIKANKTLSRVRKAMKINYFEDDSFVKEMENKFNK